MRDLFLTINLMIRRSKSLLMFPESHVEEPNPGGLLTPRKKALVVDDDSGSREYLSRLLDQQGYECQEACDAFAAMNWLDGNQVDLVTTDIHQGWCMEESGKWIPRPTGLELLEFIAQKAMSKHPTMIVMSGNMYYSPTYSERAKKAGAKGLFSKPCNEEEFLALV